jgi:hypothetical protein
MRVSDRSKGLYRWPSAHPLHQAALQLPCTNGATWTLDITPAAKASVASRVCGLRRVCAVALNDPQPVSACLHGLLPHTCSLCIPCIPCRANTCNHASTTCPRKPLMHTLAMQRTHAGPCKPFNIISSRQRVHVCAVHSVHCSPSMGAYLPVSDIHLVD